MYTTAKSYFATTTDQAHASELLHALVAEKDMVQTFVPFGATVTSLDTGFVVAAASNNNENDDAQ